jgi:hypothetical protein
MRQQVQLGRRATPVLRRALVREPMAWVPQVREPLGREWKAWELGQEHQTTWVPQVREPLGRERKAWELGQEHQTTLAALVLVQVLALGRQTTWLGQEQR